MSPMATGSNQSSLIPTRASASMPLEPSAFITISVHLLGSRSQSNVCVPFPETSPLQKS